MGRKERKLAKATLQRSRLAGELGWRTVVLTGLLGIALTLNILALIFPFLQFDETWSKELYSIPHTIQMMWDYKLYFIAILIVAFSLTFPFVKLAMLISILWLPLSREGRHKTLSVLRHLGRWSLLDVFIALIILILANNQFFIGATPRIGVGLFLGAICTSMFVCELMEYLNRGAPKQSSDPLKGRHTPVYWASGWTFWLMIPLLAISLLSLLVALGLPYFQISQFLLKHNSYSVIQSIMALQKSGSIGFAYTMLAFLVVFPMLRLISLGVLGFVPLNRTWRRIIDAWSSVVGAWSMLDVFALSLLLFMTEGARMVKFDIKNGLYLIIISVILYYITLMVGTIALRRVLRRSHDPAADTL